MQRGLLGGNMFCSRASSNFVKHSIGVDISMNVTCGGIFVNFILIPDNSKSLMLMHAVSFVVVENVNRRESR